MINKKIQAFEEKYFPRQQTYPHFRPGDTVKVNYKIEEKQGSGSERKVFAERKFRLQAFQGVVIKRKRAALRPSAATVTVRKIASGGVGVERTLPLFSPYIEGIELVTAGVVRRSRLYYLRKRFGKAARIKQKK